MDHPGLLDYLTEARGKTMRMFSLEQNFQPHFEHLEIRYEPEIQAVWIQFKFPGRPCMSRELLAEIAVAQRSIAQTAERGHEKGDKNRLMFQVLGSTDPDVFSLGGDLAHFIKLIKAGDRDALFQYAKACIDVLYPTSTSYGLPFTTISLVQGETLGGGFEAALSSNVLIAEQGATFGFPETVFGLFPGMGAFSFLARRIAPALAKRIITSGKVYKAEELYEMGVVDLLAPNGKGRETVREYIEHQQSRSLGFQCLDQVADQFNPLTYKELMDVTTLWVDAAMQLTHKNMRLMEYLVKAQDRRWNSKTVDEPRLAAAH